MDLIIWHTNDFNLLCQIAKILKSFSKTTITKAEKEKLNLYLRTLGIYNERNTDLPLDAINHKINQLSYYMFGYQAKIEHTERFMFSPLGNLLLENIEDQKKVAKIFLTMLWSLQYPHPHSGTNKVFQLYPFRLIFRLLLDERLEKKLYAFEVAYAVVFVKEATHEIYEDLVAEILRLRELPDSALAALFQADRHAYVNTIYEWDYYVSALLESAGILIKTRGELICRLQHGTTQTFRKVTRNWVAINDELSAFWFSIV